VLNWRCISVLLLVGSCLLPATAQAQSVHREVLPGGLTLVVVDQTLSHAVELRAVLRAAPVAEGDLLGTGVSRMLQRILLDAAHARRMPDGGLLADQLRGDASVEHVSYALTTTDHQLENGLALLANMLVWQGYDEADFERARAAQLGEIERRSGDALALEARELARLIYRRHPAQLPVAGLPSMLMALTPAELRAYHRRSYTASNCVLVVAGNVDIDRVRRLIRERFDVLPIGSWAPPERILEPPQYDERNAVHHARIAQGRDVYAWRTVPMQQREQAVLTLVAALLDAEHISPLRRALQDGRLAEGLRVRNHRAPERPGLLSISYAPFQAQSAEAWSTVQRVLEDLMRNGPSPEGLTAAKRRLLRQRREQLGSMHGLAQDYARWELATGVPDYGDTFQEQIAAVQADDVKRVLAVWLRPNGANRCKLLLRPLESASEGGDRRSDLALVDVPPRLSEDLGGKGARLLHRRLPIGLVHLRVVVGGGSAAEGAEQRGISALLAELMEQGSASRRGADLRNLLATSGMRLRSDSDTHVIELALTCFPEDVPRALDLLVDILQRPAMASDAVARSLQEAQSRLGDPSWQGDWDQRLQRAVHEVLLAEHYGARDRFGSKESLGNIDRDDLLQHHRRLVVGRNVVFCVYGESDAEQVAEHLDKLLAADGALPAGEAWRPEGAPWPEQDEGQVTTIAWDGDGSGVALAWRAPSLQALAEDGAAMDVLGAMLAGRNSVRHHGGGGRLMRALAGGNLPVRALRAGAEHYAGRGLWSVRVQAGETSLERVSAVLRKEVGDLLGQLGVDAGEGAIDPAELEGARELCIASRILAREDQAEAAAEHGRILLLRDSLEQDLAYEERVRSVQREDLLRVARLYLARDPAEVRLVQVQERNGASGGTGAATDGAAEEPVLDADAEVPAP